MLGGRAKGIPSRSPQAGHGGREQGRPRRPPPQGECDIPVEEEPRGGGGRGRGGHGPRRPPLALPLAGVAVDGGRDARVQQLLAELQALHHAPEGGRGEGGAPLQEGPRGSRGRDPGGPRGRQQAIPRTKTSGRARGSHHLAASPCRGRGSRARPNLVHSGSSVPRAQRDHHGATEVHFGSLITVLGHWSLGTGPRGDNTEAPRSLAGHS